MHEHRERVEASDDDLRLAHKINALVSKGSITSEQAATADPEELDRMVEKLFDPNLHQNWYRPEAIVEKEPGQRAENVIVELLNSHPLFKASHGTQEMDQREKIDIVLNIEGSQETIPLQVTSDADDASLKRKMTQLSKRTVLVLLPPAGRILDAYERHNNRDLQTILQDVVRQILQAIARNWEYRGLYQQLEERLLAA